MNIQYFMTSARQRVFSGEKDLETLVSELVRTRLATFRRFGALEVANGGRREVFQPIWSKGGQDTARNFLMRCIEELLEAAESEDPDHQLEELVDSFFYLISIRLMDPSLSVVSTPEEELLGMIRVLAPQEWTDAFAPAYVAEIRTRLSQFQLSPGFLQNVSQFLNTLRNRTWQHQVQQPYFTGHRELHTLIQSWLLLYLPAFGSVANFLVFCEAKHDVLVFRLDTHY